MALVLKDRVKETTDTTGDSAAYALGGAATGFQTFTSVLSNLDTTYYCCTDGIIFEVGLGTFASSGPTLARTTVLESSNSNNPVNWGSGTRDIFITQPAEKSVFLNSSDHLETDGGVIALKNGGSRSELRLYCESGNAHYSSLKAATHADLLSAGSDATLVLPAVSGTLLGTNNADAPAEATNANEADHVLINDGGVLKKIDPSTLGIGGGGGGSNADTVDNYHFSVVTSLPGSPDSDTIYFVTG